MNSGFDMWLQLGLSTVLLFAGLVALVARRRVLKANVMLRDATQAAESIRLMALAHQGQGKLDAALQKFLELPPSDALTDDLFNLALAFEKAKQPKKAESVLRQVQERKPGHRNVDRKLAQLREQVILAKVAAAKPAAPAKPRFGAFEVQGELGKGAIGVVYLGQDPVIGREVAIKTLPMEQDPEARARLFAEVRAAGGLSHPNIVTIYDTGEERGSCYIVMELVKGGDLARFAVPGNLLAAETVASIVARTADALGYAHREGVVHHDVRAGNILYHAAADTVKLTDFGIGRFAAGSQAASGDSRSDLFALGATLCQLLSGKLPAEVRDFDAEMPAGLGPVVARAVAANPVERFQTGEEFSGALYAAIEAGAAQSAALDIQL